MYCSMLPSRVTGPLKISASFRRPPSAIHVMGNIKVVEENGELFYQRFLLDCTAQKQREEV